MKVLQKLKTLKIYFKADMKWIVLLGFICLILNVTDLLYASLWGFILQYLMNKKFFEAVLFLLLFLVFSIIDLLSCAYRNHLQAKIEKRTIQNIQGALVKKALDLPAVAYEEKGVGEYINRIYNDTDEIINNFVNFVEIISGFITAIIIVIIFMKINVIIGFEVIIYGIIAFFITKYFVPRMKEANKKVKEENDKLSKETTQVLVGIREVKALGIKDRVSDIIGTKIKSLFTYHYDNRMLSISHFSIEWIVYSLCEFIVLFTGAFLFYKELIGIAVIILIYNYLGRINYDVKAYANFMPSYQKLVVCIDRLDEMLNDKMYLPEHYGTTHLKDVKGKISFKDVSLTYPGDENATLYDVSIEIKPDKKTAIVGASGSGKTSLFNLLLRYFDATNGEITIDDTNLLDLDEESIRNNIGVIRQDSFIFNMSIMDNFRMVKENVTLEEVRKVCKDAYIDSYIMKLPNGYETIIGENGVNLSGGQKQRLAIARTLLRNTKIILFDEATSSLDNKSQEYIKKTIDKLAKDHTVIIIAHRLSTIVDADEIILMSEGTVVSKGTHKQLMRNKIYKELYQPDIIK